MKRKHPAIERMERIHGVTVKRLCDRYHNQYFPPPAPAQKWKPKNPEIIWPPLRYEKPLSKEEWMSTNFPGHPPPKKVEGVVNVEVWKMKIQELLSKTNVDWGLVRIMQEVLAQLIHGASSHVESPGLTPTRVANWFSDPPRQIPRVVDALASFTKGGHFAGPIFNFDETKFKINSIMAVDKPGGHIRVVGNLSSPKGQSFNDGISEDRKGDWPVFMTTATQFAKMIVHAGRGAHMACSDLKDAYKMIPVTLEQRSLQAYHFCGALFLELKLIFGDKLACQYFDKFHYAILNAFVYPASNFPPVAQGRTIDDIPSVVPQGAKQTLVKFVQQYRRSLQALNLRAAENDPACIKAFDCSQEGEVLGIRFNTEDFSWSLPHAKLFSLVTDLRKLANGGKVKHSLRELQRIIGKLNHVSQLCPPLKTFSSEPIFLLGEHIKELSDDEGIISKVDRDKHIFHAPADVCQDLLLIAALLADSYHHPLPIVDPEPPVPLSATHIYTDASGHIAGSSSPALGILFPPGDMQQAGAHSLPFTTDFLLQSNSTGLVADTTSTLEALGFLIPMLIDPHRCIGRNLHLHIDNFAVVCAFKKRRSSDKLAHTIIRAAYLTAGALACKLFVTWIPRRSNDPSIIADDLTHSDFTTALAKYSYCTTAVHDAFPPPISEWMRRPVYDRNLGHHILDWMRQMYGGLL